MELHHSQQVSTAGLACMCAAALGFLHDEDGVSAIEYALLAALIVITAVGSIGALGVRVEIMWRGVSTMVAAAINGAL